MNLEKRRRSQRIVHDVHRERVNATGASSCRLEREKLYPLHIFARWATRLCTYTTFEQVDRRRSCEIHLRANRRSFVPVFSAVSCTVLL